MSKNNEFLELVYARVILCTCVANLFTWFSFFHILKNIFIYIFHCHCRYVFLQVSGCLLASADHNVLITIHFFVHFWFCVAKIRYEKHKKKTKQIEHLSNTTGAHVSTILAFVYSYRHLIISNIFFVQTPNSCRFLSLIFSKQKRLFIRHSGIPFSFTLVPVPIHFKVCMDFVVSIPVVMGWHVACYHFWIWFIKCMFIERRRHLSTGTTRVSFSIPY